MFTQSRACLFESVFWQIAPAYNGVLIKRMAEVAVLLLWVDGIRIVMRIGSEGRIVCELLTIHVCPVRDTCNTDAISTNYPGQ